MKKLDKDFPNKIIQYINKTWYWDTPMLMNIKNEVKKHRYNICVSGNGFNLCDKITRQNYQSVIQSIIDNINIIDKIKLKGDEAWN